MLDTATLVTSHRSVFVCSETKESKKMKVSLTHRNAGDHFLECTMTSQYLWLSEQNNNVMMSMLFLIFSNDMLSSNDGTLTFANYFCVYCPDNNGTGKNQQFFYY